ncbi:unnamed protein product [Heterobilharzia americana]|nr:unnamed protein product [Heterobilharzia americana]
MWSLYWNVLAYTAPVHRLFMEYVTHSKVESGTLQKYSVVVWLIRQQFLGETAPGSSDIHTCLTSLIRLTETWGTNLEVIRSLWLYFKGRLNTGFDTSDSSSSGLVLPNMSFRNWYSKSKSDDEGMQNFILLCSLLRKLPSSDYGELCVILQISLLSLSRNGISYYFYIWANLIEEALNTLKMTTNNNENIQKCVLSMVDSVVVLCAAISQSAGVTQSGVRNWDPSRGCVVLQCLQYLMVICKECWLLHSESDVFCLSKVNCCLLSVVDKINSAIIPLRRALSPLSQVSPADSEYSSIPRSSTFNRLSASSWIAEVTSISTQFLIDLISTHNSAHFPLHSDQVSFIVRCLGSSYFDSFGWSFDVKWNEAILLLIEAVCSLTPCEANLEIFNFIWNVVYSEFRKAVSRSNTKFTPIPVGSLSVLSMISFHFLHVSKICSSFHSNRIVTCQFPDPAEVFELFTMDTSIDFSFHFSILEKCYGTSNAVKELLNILSSSEKSASTIAWLFLITLLTYTLLVKTTIHSFSTEYFDAFILPSFMSEIHPFLPVQTDSTISSIDAELIFLNISSHFDKLSTFHSRMTFKSVFAQHFGRLSEFIWTCCSVSSSAKENGFGLGYLIQTSFMKPEDLCSKGYRAVGMLARYCSMLLYAPVTTEGSASSFENLVNHFILPRQLYEIQDPKKISALNEWNTFPNYVLDSIQEQLPEFSCGVAQLNWRSDPYLCRVLKDFVKLHYKQLGPQAIATVVLNSPSLDFRAHILQLATQDQINHLAENETASFSNSERITSQQNILVRWMKFANAVYADTHSNEGYQRDAPFLVCPILFAYTLKDLTGTLSSDSRKQGARILTVYKEAVESITCKELRSQVYEQCYNLDKKTVDSRCSLITFFGLKNNVS